MPQTFKPEDLDTIQCDFCGSNERNHLHLYTRPDGLKVVLCITCGLGFLNPRPKPEHIPNFYHLHYFQRTYGPGGQQHEEYLSDIHREGLAAKAKAALGLISRDYALGGKSVLEIGSATGEFCFEIAKMAGQVKGIDISHQVVEVASARYPKLHFRSGTIENLKDDERFHVIVAFEVIEHVTSPITFLRNIRYHLHEDGLVVLSTPNLACGRAVGFENWIGFQTSFEHLYFFTPDILHRYGARAGLRLSTWYTGFGNGRMPIRLRRSDLKLIVKNQVVRFGLWELFSKINRARCKLMKAQPRLFKPRGNSHDLLMLFHG